MSDFSHESTLLQHGASSRRLTLSYSHTTVATWTHTVHSHPFFTIAQYTHEQTPLRQIWHPPPVVTFLHLPSSLSHGRHSRRHGVCEMPQSAKKPPSLPSKLGMVVVCCCANVLRGSLQTAPVARYNSTERAAAGGVGKGDASACGPQVAPPTSYSLS